MFNLLNLKEVDLACDDHFDALHDFIYFKLSMPVKDLSKYKSILAKKKSNNATTSLIKNFLIQKSPGLNEIRINKLLKGNPRELLIINDEFIDYILTPNGFDLLKEGYTERLITDNFSNRKHPKLFEIYKELNIILNYKEFKSWNPNHVYSSYKLAENLGVRACTYCNRTFILVHKTENGGKLLCPQFDHWFPSSKFPLLQVSFYNLIPSCGSCNSSVKSSEVLSIDKYSHPYIDWNGDAFKFNYHLVNDSRKYKIVVQAADISSNYKLLRTVRKLKIDQMYNGHLPELQDMINLRQAYGESYLDTLNKSFTKLNSFKPSDVYKMHFGTEMNELNFHQRPLSKFKNDILKNLKLIEDS